MLEMLPNGRLLEQPPRTHAGVDTSFEQQESVRVRQPAFSPPLTLLPNDIISRIKSASHVTGVPLRTSSCPGSIEIVLLSGDELHGSLLP